MTSTAIAVVAGLIVLLVVMVLVGRRAIRRLRHFVRSFWPHS
jgi:hypothetical protein